MKDFDHFDWHSLFKIIAKIGCPLRFFKIVQSFHADMGGIIQFNGSFSEGFNIHNSVKSGCVLIPHPIWHLFCSHVLQSRRLLMVFIFTPDQLVSFSLSGQKAKSKVSQVLIREMLFTDDAALTAYAEEQMQHLIDKLSRPVRNSAWLSMRRRPKYRAKHPATISINNYKLEIVHEFTYLGSTITDELSRDPEINRKIGQASFTFAKFKKSRETGNWLQKPRLLCIRCARASTLDRSGISITPTFVIWDAYCMGNWLLAQEHEDDPIFVSRTSAREISSHLI